MISLQLGFLSKSSNCYAWRYFRSILFLYLYVKQRLKTKPLININMDYKEKKYENLLLNEKTILRNLLKILAKK